MCCEKFLNGLLHFSDVGGFVGGLQKVLGPEPACIFQSISNVDLPENRKVFDLTENSIVIQVADILLQPLPHEPEARKQNLYMMNFRLYKKTFYLRSDVSP